jgi:hypothetical protein
MFERDRSLRQPFSLNNGGYDFKWILINRIHVSNQEIFHTSPREHLRLAWHDDNTRIFPMYYMYHRVTDVPRIAKPSVRHKTRHLKRWPSWPYVSQFACQHPILSYHGSSSP